MNREIEALQRALRELPLDSEQRRRISEELRRLTEQEVRSLLQSQRKFVA